MSRIITPLLLSLLALSAAADTTITYQGQLQDSGNPFNGQVEMTFELFDDFDPDDPAMGNSISGPLTINDVPVTDGLFQVELDFGAVYEQPVWIEITVGTDTLHPRQRLTSAPVAVRALHVADGVSGVWEKSGDSIEYFANNQRVLIQPHSTAEWAPRIAIGNSNNIASSAGTTILGGGSDNEPNTAFAPYAVISGGLGNTIDGYLSAISGGGFNTSEGRASNISGGENNATWDNHAVIGGGQGNSAGSNDADPTTAEFATVGGGADNIASGAYATIPGGQDNKAAGDHSFAAGVNAHADHDGSFVWADSSGGTLSTTASNEFRARANGGFMFATGGTFCELQDGFAGWNCQSVSDPNAKSDIEVASVGTILRQVVELPIYTWRYKEFSTEDLRIGPMAQDFHAAFDLGGSETTIRAHDLASIGLAAVQALNTKLHDERDRNDRLEQRFNALEGKNARLNAENDELKRRLADLEALVIGNQEIANQ